MKIYLILATGLSSGLMYVFGQDKQIAQTPVKFYHAINAGIPIKNGIPGIIYSDMMQFKLLTGISRFLLLMKSGQKV